VIPRSTSLIVVLAVGASACAARPRPVTAPAPAHHDYVYPSVPADLSRAFAQASRDHAAAWQALLGGDEAQSGRRFSAILRSTPGFYPSETALGYVALAARRNDAALEAFDHVLSRQAGYAPALAGRGEALLASGREADALAAFDAAVAADASLEAVKQRAELLRLRVVEQALGSARQLASEGKWPQAEAAYAHVLAVSPDNAVALGEAAAVERRLGKSQSAKAYAERALWNDPGDIRSALIVADVLVEEGRADEALAALERARDATPSGELDDRIAGLRARAAEAALPEEYRAIPESPQVTRAQLAALVGIRFGPLLGGAAPARTVLVTDARASWAQPWILKVVAAGIMDVYPNHTFEPQRRIDRAELAQVATRLLALAATQTGRRGDYGSAARAFSDIGPGHLAYPAASAAVAAGVMDVAEGGAFGPSLRATGPEAMATVRRLEELLRP